MSGNGEVEVKLYGALVSYAGTKALRTCILGPLPLEAFLRELGSRLPEEFNSAIQNRSNILVIVNGIEVSVLDQVGIEISPGDKVVLLPVSHGGGGRERLRVKTDSS